MQLAGKEPATKDLCSGSGGKSFDLILPRFTFALHLEFVEINLFVTVCLLKSWDATTSVGLTMLSVIGGGEKISDMR